MKNTSFFKNTSLWILLSCVFSLSAQQMASVVTDTKTDKTFANTTEIYKSEKASDTQVLAEIAGNFGLGDVVRITVAPPKPAVVKASAPVVEKQERGIVVENTPQAVKLVSVENKENITPTEVINVENKVEKVTSRATKSSNSNKSVKSSKSNSRKSFSLFKNFSFKSSKRNKVKSGKKYGCYKF